MNLNLAEPIANRLLIALAPFCDKIEIAGSIRRQREDVKDIEIVCVAKEVLSGEDLFGAPKKVRSQEFIDTLIMMGKLVKGSPKNGRYVKLQRQIELPFADRISIDVFITTNEDFYRMFAIRTGPAEYSHKIIARRWSQMGWVGTEYGLRLKKEIENPYFGYTLPPVFKSEQDFFSWLGLEYLAPENRF